MQPEIRGIGCPGLARSCLALITPKALRCVLSYAVDHISFSSVVGVCYASFRCHQACACLIKGKFEFFNFEFKIMNSVKPPLLLPFAVDVIPSCTDSTLVLTDSTLVLSHALAHIDSAYKCILLLHNILASVFVMERERRIVGIWGPLARVDVFFFILKGRSSVVPPLTSVAGDTCVDHEPSLSACQRRRADDPTSDAMADCLLFVHEHLPPKQ